MKLKVKMMLPRSYYLSIEYLRFVWISFLLLLRKSKYLFMYDPLLNTVSILKHR